MTAAFIGMPRVLLAVIVGAALAVSGTALQTTYKANSDPTHRRRSQHRQADLAVGPVRGQRVPLDL